MSRAHPTAEYLGGLGTRGGRVDEVVKLMLRSINDRLAQHPTTWGRNVVTVPVPVFWTELNGGNLDKAGAQRLVYSQIINDLRSKGFELALHIGQKSAVLYVAWMSDLSAEEAAAMDALINSVRIEPEQVDAFVHHGRLRAPASALAVQAGRAPPPPAVRVTDKRREMHPRAGVVSRDAPRADGAPADDAGLVALLGLSGTALPGAPDPALAYSAPAASPRSARGGGGRRG